MKLGLPDVKEPSQFSHKKLKTQPNLNAEFYIDVFSLVCPAKNERSNILYHISDFLTLQKNWCIMARKILSRLHVTKVWMQSGFCRVRKKWFASNPSTFLPVISCFSKSVFVSVRQTFETQVIRNVVPSNAVKSMPFQSSYAINFKYAFFCLFPTLGYWQAAKSHVLHCASCSWLFL